MLKFEMVGNYRIFPVIQYLRPVMFGIQKKLQGNFENGFRFNGINFGFKI